MTVELITGHAGSAHISSADDGWRFAGTYGPGNYVLDTGTQLACNVVSANLCTIGAGDAIFEGRHVRVINTTNVSIDNGAQGMNRNDIICLVYDYDTGTEVESASLEVVKGTATAGTPSDPTIPSGNILEGSETAYFPLWRIPIAGLSIGTPAKLFGNVLVTLKGIESKVWSASQIPNLSAAKITSGALGVDRIPNLDASKITSGTLADARIPNLAASKITSGTFSADRIPGLAASKITSGTFAADRIPALAASKITSGAFDAARIPNLPASKITSGTLAVAQGGTGVSTAGVNKVFAGPNSGSSAAAPSFRALVSADIPSLDASKIGSGILGTARGGTGNANGTVAKLTTARTIRTNLASTSTASFDGSANVTPGVTGTLGVANGGTGKTAGTCLMGFSLYHSTGTTGNVTLSFPTGITTSSLKKLEIYYRDNDNTSGMTALVSRNGFGNIWSNSEHANLTVAVYVSGTMWIKTRRVIYNDGVLSNQNTSGGTSNFAGYVGASSSGNEVGNTNQIYITDVIGYC